MGTSLYQQYRAESSGSDTGPPRSLYAQYQLEQTARQMFADQGREGLPVPIDPTQPASAGLGSSLERGGVPRTIPQEVGHALSGVVAEPAIEGLVQAAPFLMGTAHAIPGVLKAAASFNPVNPVGSAKAVTEALDEGKAAREAATQRYAETPLFGVGPSTNSIAAALRARMGQPETPAEQVAGTVSMLATPALAGGGIAALLRKGGTVAADAAAAGLRGPLTADLPPTDLPEPPVTLPLPERVPTPPSVEPPSAGPEPSPLYAQFQQETAAPETKVTPTLADMKRADRLKDLERPAAAVSTAIRRKPVARQSVDELYDHLDYATQEAQKAQPPAPWIRFDDDISETRVGGTGIAGAIYRQRGETIDRIVEALKAKGQTEDQIWGRLDDIHAQRQTAIGLDDEAVHRPYAGGFAASAYPEEGVPFSPMAGKGALPILGGLTGAGVGATAGAKGDTEHPIRGALLGGLAGAVGGAALGHSAENMGQRGITQVGRDLPQPDLTPTEGPLRKPDANTVARMIDLTPDEQQRVSTVLRGLPDKGVEPHAAVKAEAAKILQSDPSLLRTIDPKRMNGAETLAAAMRVSDNEAKISQLAERYLAARGDEQAAYGERIASLQREQSDLLKAISAGGTATGRDLNARKILARMSNNPVSWMIRAQQIAERPLTDLERATIAGFFKGQSPEAGIGERGAIGIPRRVKPNVTPQMETPAQQATVTGLMDQGKRAEMLRYIGTLRPSSAIDKAISVWKAGLLTGLRTLKAPTLARTSLAVTEEAARPIAVGIDVLMSHFTGFRSKSLLTRQMAEASARGAAQGLKAIPDAMRGLPVLQALERGDVPHETWFGNQAVSHVLNAPFRLHESANLPFYSAAFGGSLAEQAGLMAKAEGLTGKAALARASELVENPTPEMGLRATQDALFRTNRNPTAVGGMLRAIQQKGGAVGNVIVPFSTVPGAVATTFAESTPYGLAKGAYLLRKAVTQLKAAGVPDAELLAKGFQQHGAETMARGALGSALMVAGAMLWKHHLASGTTPKEDKTQRGENALEGKPDDAFLVKGSWYQPNRSGSWGMLLSLGAAVAQASEGAPGTLSAVGSGASAGARIIIDQPFLTGITSLKDAIDQGGNTAANYFRQMGSSVVPSGLAEAARATDPTIRDARTLGTLIQSKIPSGLGIPGSQELPAKPNQLGQPSQRFRADYRNVFSPVESTPDRRPGDPLLTELDRLGVDLSSTAQIQPGESREDWRARAAATGQYLSAQLRAIIADPRYRALSDPQREEVLKREAQRIHGASTRQQKERLATQPR